MSNLTQYQTFNDNQPPIEPDYRQPSTRIVGAVTKVSSTDGVMTSNTQEQERGSMAELNPHHGDGTALATARHPRGLPVYEIEPDTIVTVNGVEAPVSFWVKEGYLQKTPTGYAEATPEAAPQEASTAEVLPIPQEHMDIINAALEPMPQENLDAFIGVAVGASTGRLTMEQFQRKFTEMSGIGGADGASRLEAVWATYQAQTNAALTTRYGLGQDDLPAFYLWAQQHNTGAMTDALQRQFRTHDVSGWKALVNQWQAKTPPSLQAFKANGIPTRTMAGKPEVFVRGSWMSPGAAARAGLV
jgi:hypothetical protein